MVILSFIIGTPFVVSGSYADNASVSVPQGTSVPGCEDANKCFLPYHVTIDVGSTIIWSNDDSEPHTVTSGSAADGADGVFNSGLFMAGTTFSHKFESVGEFPYVCLVHPWMEGIVTVEASNDQDDFVLNLKSIADRIVTEGETLSFIASVTDNSIDGLTYSLEKNPPSGASINSSTGQFIWTPTASQGNTNGIQYNFDIVVEKGTQKDSESITITVKDPVSAPPKELGIAPFVDPGQDPQYYVDRYNNEYDYKKWFDDNFPEYDSIYPAVGLGEPLLIPAPFVEPYQDPQYYVDRYNNEPSYKKWFDDNFPEYDSIYQAVELKEIIPIPPAPEQKSKIPEWVRNIFIWYAEDRISEDELIESLEFLIVEGIIKV